MDVSNFVSPLETVQLLSIFTYVNTLSDFLFAENYLSEQDQRKQIPVVNALYKFLEDENRQDDLQTRKTLLVKKLINGTNLYGSKETENPDPHFVTTLLNHITSSLVFQEFTNIYGFIASTVRNFQTDSLMSVYRRMQKVLATLPFENESGETSQLDPLVADKIFADLVLPLIPEPSKYPVRFSSIEYIYALAGNMFFRSGQTEILKKAQKNQMVRNNEVYEDMSKIGYNRAGDNNLSYDDFVEVAHTIEELVLAKKLNETVLKIFALPALVNYVYSNKQLRTISIHDIMESPVHWRKAYRQLFSILHEAKTEHHQAEFYLALSNFRNRSTLARELIELECPEMSSSELEEEVTRYKNHPDSYRCIARHADNQNDQITDLSDVNLYNSKLYNHESKNHPNQTLTDLNHLFQQQVDNTTQIYKIFEKESCRTAFGKDFISTIDKTNVIISRGLIQYAYVYSGISPGEEQLVKPSADMLQFYYPDNDTYTYYGLIRQNYNVSLITQYPNPDAFRESLGLSTDQHFRSNFFPTVLKEQDQKFEVLLEKIATERSIQFKAQLSAAYDETRTEFWTNLGLSLIPFYSCVVDIKAKDYKAATLACPLDGLLLLPLIGELGTVSKEVGMVVYKSTMAVSETTFRAIAVRASIRSILRITGRALIDEVGEFASVITAKTFRNLGTSFLRFIDPGFELVFSLGKGGLRSIKSILSLAEKRHSITSLSVKGMLTKMEAALDKLPKKVEGIFDRHVYVKSLSRDAGYGYKFFPLRNGELAEIRTVHGSRKEIPVVVSQAVDSEDSILKQGSRTYQQMDQGSKAVFHKMGLDETKSFKQVELSSEEMIGEDYFQDEEGFIVSESEVFEMKVQEAGESTVEAGNFIKEAVKTANAKRNLLKEAIQFGVNKRKLPEPLIKDELKKYAFPAHGKTEVNFVREWMNHAELKIPDWAAEYRIPEYDLFFELKYKETLESSEITLEEATKRINALYNSRDREEILKELQVDKVLEDFKVRQAYNQATFEDYYALRYYGGSGYKKMAESLDETRRMKNAIYRLAIRQSEDPSEPFVRTLFRGEARFPEAIEKELSQPVLEFNRFTSVSTDIAKSIEYSLRGEASKTKVLYEMRFRNPIVRARVEHLFVLDEKETILLPGTKFRIDSLERSNEMTKSGVEQKCIKVVMTHMDEAMTKIQRQKNIMGEIRKLMSTNTNFYHRSAPDV